MPEPLGMLEQRHGHVHDRGRPLHAGLRVLRGQNGQTAGTGIDEPARRGRSHPPHETQHVVITAVARDDLADGGRGTFPANHRKVRELNPGIAIEVLVPDFLDREESIDLVLEARPHIYNHNWKRCGV